MQDRSTQLRDRYLAPHLRNYDVASRSETTITEESSHYTLRKQPEPSTRKVSVQTGRFGPTSKKNILKCVSVKYPSTACLKRLGELRPSPRITDCEVVTSKFEKGLCLWLLEAMKRQAGEDPLFKRIENNVYARMYGTDWDQITASSSNKDTNYTIPTSSLFIIIHAPVGPLGRDEQGTFLLLWLSRIL